MNKTIQFYKNPINLALALTVISILLILLLPLTGCTEDNPAYLINPFGTGVGTSNETPIYVNYPTISVNTTDLMSHSSWHENGGEDEISVTGLSGLLADDQHVLDSEVITAVENETELYVDLLAPDISGTIDFDGYNINVAGLYFGVVTTNAGSGIQLHNDAQGDTGAGITLTHDSQSPADGDDIGRFLFEGRDSAQDWGYYGWFACEATDVTSGTEDSQYEWWLYNAGGYNLAMTLDGDGTLKVDAGYDTFDEYDDAIRLKRAFSDGEKTALVEIGVLEQVSYNGTTKYVIDTQKMIALLAGGVYQNRDRIDQLEARISLLEGAK